MRHIEIATVGDSPSEGGELHSRYAEAISVARHVAGLFFAFFRQEAGALGRVVGSRDLAKTEVLCVLDHPVIAEPPSEDLEEEVVRMSYSVGEIEAVAAHERDVLVGIEDALVQCSETD